MPRRSRPARPRAVIAAAASTSALALAVALAGCGSESVSQLPPAATPPPSPPLQRAPAGHALAVAAAAAAQRGASGAGGVRASLDDGRLLAVLDPRARTLAIRDARGGRRLAVTDAGVGPTRLSCVGAGLCYVTDTRGNALLVFQVAPGGRELRLTRRVFLAGGPSAIAHDAGRYRLWVVLPGRNAVAELPAHGSPHVLRVVPVPRHARSVAVTPGGALLIGAGRTVQQYDPDHEHEG